MSWLAILCFGTAIERTLGALNLAFGIEDKVLKLRDRLVVSDGLVTSLARNGCDSLADGPQCSHLELAVASLASRYDKTKQRQGIAAEPLAAALLTDGILSARLFGSNNGMELVDELMRSRPEETSDKYDAGHSRSALLSFHKMPPWQMTFPRDFSGSLAVKGTVPFDVHWEGPWELAENPIKGSPVVKLGRYTAQLHGPLGTIKFGRAVHVQAIDLARPLESECVRRLEEDYWRASSKSEILQTPPLSAIVVRGRRAGEEVFNEVVPPWELTTFVNSVAFAALTSIETVDEIIFLSADCIMIGAVQLTFSERTSAVDKKSYDVSRNQKRMITLRDGWRAYGFEDVNIASLPSADIVEAPVWSLNDVFRRRLTLRQLSFEDPPMVLMDDGVLPNDGPEPIGMPETLMSIDEKDFEQVDTIESFMQSQRNVTLLRQAMSKLLAQTKAAILNAGKESPPKIEVPFLRGFHWRDLLDDMLRLLNALTEAAEGASAEVLRSSTSNEAFDSTWRRLGLFYLDCVLIRWQSAEGHKASAVLVTKREDNGGSGGRGYAVDQTGEFTDEFVEEMSAHGDAIEFAGKLMSAIQEADGIIERRTQAKNAKLKTFTSATQAAKSSSGKSYDVRMEANADGSGLRVVVTDGSGREVASDIAMPQAEVDLLLQHLDPASKSQVDLQAMIADFPSDEEEQN